MITGAAYGLLALGLVLIYKSSGVFNFAQGEFGTVAVYVLYLLHFDVPYGVALLGALVAAVVMGLLVERLVVRPLFDAPAGHPARRHGRRRAARHRRSRSGSASRPAPIARALRPGSNRVTVLGVQISDQRLLLLGALVVLAVAARAVLQPDQPRPGDPRREPGADRHRAGGHQRAPALELHVGARRPARRARRRARRPRGRRLRARRHDDAFLIPAFTAAVLGGMTSLPGAFLGGVIVGVVEAVGTSAPIFDGHPRARRARCSCSSCCSSCSLVRPQGLLGKRVLMTSMTHPTRRRPRRRGRRARRRRSGRRCGGWASPRRRLGRARVAYSCCCSRSARAVRGPARTPRR